jgi:hyperosmotically inducible protein
MPLLDHSTYRSSVVFDIPRSTRQANRFTRGTAEDSPQGRVPPGIVHRFPGKSPALPSTGSTTIPKEHLMINRLAIAAMVATLTIVSATGCAVERHQETVGSYVDDSAVTTKIKAKFADDPTVSAMAIKVDTMKGVVQLSGFAKSGEERMMAERLARSTNGVTDVRNDIIVKQ